MRTRRLLPVAAACALGWALAPGAAQAAATARPAASPAARPVASLVDDIAPGPASSDPQDLTAMNGELYFTAWSPRHGRQLWKSNGTARGTAMLTHVAGPAGADPQDLTAADGVLFFSARAPGHGRQLWKSNGTAAGTTQVSHIAPAPVGLDPAGITYAIGQQVLSPTPGQVLVYFSGWDPVHGRQLWRSNGTTAGTVRITGVNPGPARGLAPLDIAPLTGTTAMFSGNDGVHGRQPWVTDGTTAGTHMYEDLNPGPAGSDPAQITPEIYPMGILTDYPVWYFSANDGHGREFFIAYDDDPPADVYDIRPGHASPDPGPFDSVTAETGLLAATGATGGRGLFEVPQPPFPPAAGTVTKVAGVGPGHGSDPLLAPASLIGYDPSLSGWATRTYFVGDDAGHGRQLWQADEFVIIGAGEGGTFSFAVAGVRLVDDINPAGASPQDLTAVGGTPVLTSVTGATEVFSANDGRHGRQLWYSDGWPGNTRMAADINPGPAGSDPQDITAVGQVVYFSAFDRAHGRELWKLTVPPAPSIFLQSPFGQVSTGSPQAFSVTVNSAPGAPEPTGTVTFFEDGRKIGVRPLAPSSSGPTATLNIKTPSGTRQIVAVYSGDRRYLPATSNTCSIASKQIQDCFQALPASLFEHPAAELPEDDSARLHEHRAVLRAVGLQHRSQCLWRLSWLPG
jgi:ELWxxDGT repeat protein